MEGLKQAPANTYTVQITSDLRCILVVSAYPNEKILGLHCRAVFYRRHQRSGQRGQKGLHSNFLVLTELSMTLAD